MTLESSSRMCHCYVTMRVLSSSPTIRFNMQEQSTLMSVGTEDQLANIFTKPLAEKRFFKLRNELNILDFSNKC
jgi:hypothetical protein